MMVIGQSPVCAILIVVHTRHRNLQPEESILADRAMQSKKSRQKAEMNDAVTKAILYFAHLRYFLHV